LAPCLQDARSGGLVGGSEGEQKETILVVEDVESIRKMVCVMLAQVGYRCVEANDGEEAYRIVHGAPQALDLVLTDVMMPKMGGPELARRVAQLRPDLRVLFMSGYSDDAVVRSIERSASLFLVKPFTASALLEKVRLALERPWMGLPDPNVGAGAR
jgi:two-component system cell cycle sensor histidine kinase/response regulator CckA